MEKDIVLMDLFSGIGGFALGLKQAGFNIKKHLFSEIDKHAIANYKYNFKHAEHIGSVTDVHGTRGQADIITFGSPCQDFSLAGKRKGMDGQRSSLIMEAIRLISEIQPSVFIWENVKGTFSSNDGADFWAILNAFTNIGGYRLEWQLLNTSWVLPQNRERIYLIGHLAGRSECGVFPITENDRLFNQENQPDGRRPQAQHSTAIKASGTVKADDTFIEVSKNATCLNSSSAKMVASDTYINVIPVLTPDRKEKLQNGRRFKEPGDPSFTLNCQDMHGVMITSATKQGFEVATLEDSINFSQPNSQTRRGRVGKKQAQTLDTACNQGVITHYGHKNKSAKISNLSPTLKAQSHGHEPMTFQDSKIRRLTEIECERLQGFPDNWTQFGNYDGTIKPISKTQRYKLCGNAVSTKIVQLAAERLNIN